VDPTGRSPIRGWEERPPCGFIDRDLGMSVQGAREDAVTTYAPAVLPAPQRPAGPRRFVGHASTAQGDRERFRESYDLWVSTFSEPSRCSRGRWPRRRQPTATQNLRGARIPDFPVRARAKNRARDGWVSHSLARANGSYPAPNNRNSNPLYAPASSSKIPPASYGDSPQSAPPGLLLASRPGLLFESG
jgi:hypothetical protein